LSGEISEDVDEVTLPESVEAFFSDDSLGTVGQQL
jgi:hypothetical protein